MTWVSKLGSSSIPRTYGLIDGERIRLAHPSSSLAARTCSSCPDMQMEDQTTTVWTRKGTSANAGGSSLYGPVENTSYRSRSQAALHIDAFLSTLDQPCRSATNILTLTTFPTTRSLRLPSNPEKYKSRGALPARAILVFHPLTQALRSVQEAKEKHGSRMFLHPPVLRINFQR